MRIHSVGGWGAITMGKNLASTVFDLLGLDIKANPKYGSEKKGQPTTFYATFAHEPIRLNCELAHVDVVLSPDPNVFRHTDPLAGLADGGAFVIQSDLAPEAWWRSLPMTARRALKTRKIRVASARRLRDRRRRGVGHELKYRMQGAAFMGAFFAVSPLADAKGSNEARLFAGIRAQLEKKFSKLGERVVADNLRVIERGYRELRAVDCASMPLDGDDDAAVPRFRSLLDDDGRDAGLRQSRSVLGAGLLSRQDWTAMASPIRTRRSARFPPRPAPCAT